MGKSWARFSDDSACGFHAGFEGDMDLVGSGGLILYLQGLRWCVADGEGNFVLLGTALVVADASGGAEKFGHG